ncbi:HAD family hydrolase [Pseudidiomarina sediminum]|uniref:HAD family hydrolase n=1 Tax=Pseudidiomarina sediminum TaxID=431675 RepID=UPI001C97BDDC|nr:HAD-IA family hydrolase [Pseudidiomarina sediminum]MBY6062978.1 HAD-IA family hydrolase [Pseudidiomarina sediminum]
MTLAAPDLRPSAVLFDLDGTLLDTAPDLCAALNTVLHAEGRPALDLATARLQATHGSRSLLDYAFGDTDAARRQQLRQAFLTAYQQAIAVHTCYYQGITEVLAHLQQAEIPTAIVTNKPGALTEQLVPYFPELHHISVRVAGDTLAVAKPHPEPLLLAADQLGIAAENCWYVGDAETDIIAGRTAGMRTALASYGYCAPNAALETWGADWILRAPNDLLQLLR